MRYFAMIHWDNDAITPVSGEMGVESAKLWGSYQEALDAVKAMPEYDIHEITIHDDCGE